MHHMSTERAGKVRRKINSMQNLPLINHPQKITPNWSPLPAAMSRQRHLSTSRKRATFVKVLLASTLGVATHWAAHSARQPAAQQLQSLPAASDSELPTQSGTLEASDLSLEEARCYLQRYPDLQELFGENVDDAKRHWKEKGRLEQRVVKCPFLPTTYNSSFVKASSSTILYVLDNQLYHVHPAVHADPSEASVMGRFQ